MKIASVEARINRILLDVLEITDDEIRLDDDLGACGLDSMKSVHLIVELEEQFNFAYEDEELIFENFSTLQKIIDRINAKLMIIS
jgi:acyl carrier protein